MKHTVFLCAMLALIGGPGLTLSGQATTPALTLEDIYKNGTYSTRYYRSVRWMEDSQHYTTLELNRERSCSEIIRYRAKDGERVVLVGADQLVPDGEENPLSIRDYQWSDDNSKLLLFTNTRRVWRYHTRGDYWVLDLSSGKLQQVGLSLPSSSLMFAKFSPSGTDVAYVRENNLYVEEIDSGEITALTREPSGRRASHSGWLSSMRRPTWATILSMTRRRCISSTKVTEGSFDSLPLRSTKHCSGPLTMISVTSSSRSNLSMGP